MNWKYILIIILIIIIGGAIFIYQNRNQQGELNIQKTVGSFLLSVTEIRRISNTQATPHLNTVTDKDVLVLDLLFTASSECEEGCYVSTLINDYKLTTADGTLRQLGEYSTKWESAPFLNYKYSGNQALKPEEKGEHQAYFFIEETDNDFIFTYTEPASGESQSYRLKLK